MTSTSSSRPSRVVHRAVYVVGVATMALLALLGLDAVSYAATGDSLVIGAINTGDTTTTLKNTGPGATLSLFSRSNSTPTLRVSSTARVAKLNADLVDGLDSTAFLGAGGKAVDSETLDGLDSTQFLRADGTAVNSDNLDGLDSTSFVRGPGALYKGAAAVPANSGGWYPVLFTSQLPIVVGYNCPADLGTNGVVVLRNDSNETVNVFSDNGGTSPAYRSIGPGGRWDQGGAAAGEHISFQIQGSTIVDIEWYSVHRSSDCHTQAIATVVR